MNLSIRNIRVIYRTVMVVLALCVLIDTYRIFNPHLKNTIFTIVLFISPLALICYLLLVLKYRKNLQKKLHEQRQKFFSKN